MSPSWYDLLDVEPDATTEEIRAAWVASIAGLDPTDRQFRSRSRAAEVLLDPTRRAAYDAELAAQDDEENGVEEGAEDGTSPLVEEGRSPVPRTGRSSAAGGAATKAEKRRTTTPTGTLTSTPADDTHDKPDEHPREPASRRTVVGTAALAALALVLVAVTVFAWLRGGTDGAPDAQEVQSAESAAVAAIVPILSYDYRTLDADAEAATSYMTPRFAAEYDQYFAAAVQTNAPSTRTIVTNEVVESGIARTGPGRVDVLLFVNQLSVNRQTGPDNPKVLRNGVTARMVEQDGDWLVECLITTLGGSCGGDDDPAPTTD